MENFEQFRTFKTQKCPESLCHCYKQTSNKQKPLNGYADCFYYHNADDKRRPPFDNASPPALLYNSEYTGNKYIKAEPEDCQNEIEYLYHPFEFKVKACSVCYGDFCPNYHDNDDRDFWKKILKEYRDLNLTCLSAITMNKSSNEGNNKNSSGNDSTAKFSNDNTLNLSHHYGSDTVQFQNFLENLEEEHPAESSEKLILPNNNSNKILKETESENLNSKSNLEIRTTAQILGQVSLGNFSLKIQTTNLNPKKASLDNFTWILHLKIPQKIKKRE